MRALGIVMAVMVIIFAAVLAVLVGTRIDQGTIALLSGTVIGIISTIPCAAMITYILVRAHDREQAEREQRQIDQARMRLMPTKAEMDRRMAEWIQLQEAECRRELLEAGRE